MTFLLVIYRTYLVSYCTFWFLILSRKHCIEVVRTCWPVLDWLFYRTSCSFLKKLPHCHRLLQFLVFLSTEHYECAKYICHFFPLHITFQQLHKAPIIAGFGSKACTCTPLFFYIIENFKQIILQFNHTIF